MRTLTVSDWAVRVFVGAMAVASLSMMVLGFYWNDWRASLGIVLFTTSVLCNVCVYLLPETGLKSDPRVEERAA